MPCIFHPLARIQELLHTETEGTRTFSISEADCKLTSIICNNPSTFILEGMPGLSSSLLGTTVTLIAVVFLIPLVFSWLFWSHGEWYWDCLSRLSLSTCVVLDISGMNAAHSTMKKQSFVVCNQFLPLGGVLFAEHRTTPRAVLFYNQYN